MDHMLDCIRGMKFEASVASVSRGRGFGGKTPHVLLWDKLCPTIMTLDYDLLAGNLDYYLTNVTRGSR